MASNIVSTTIDENFPTPGVDNDTQGFRDNFDIIKTALAEATVEIGELQDDTAKLNVDNNFDGNSIVSAKFQGSGDAVYSQTNGLPVTINGSNNSLSWNTASYYAYVADGTPTWELTMAGWPSPGQGALGDGILGKIVVQVTAKTTAQTITFNTTNTAPSTITFKTISHVGAPGVIKIPTGLDNPVTLALGTTNIYEFWTIDGGATVYGRLLGSYT